MYMRNTMNKKEKVTNKVPGLNKVDCRYTNSQALKEKNKAITKESDSPEFNNVKY